MNIARAAAVALAIMVVLGTDQARAQEDSFWSSLIDPTDGYPDASRYLARGGFVPIPIIITEPALGGGLGVAANFVRMPEGGGSTPTRTILGGAYTGNGSNGIFAMRSGAAYDDSILYLAALGAGTINLDFYPFGGNIPVSYTNRNRGAFFQARRRIGDSGFSAGTSLLYRTTAVSIDSDRFPGLADRLRRDATLTAIGFEAHFDDRDNAISPRRGVNALLSVRGYDSAWGSDEDFIQSKLFGAGFHSAGSWTLGLMAKAQSVSDDAPFYLAPSIDIRGVSLNRYQGEEVLSSEIELRRQFHPRWAAVGFAGYGYATSPDSRTFQDTASVFAGGAGIRYRVARALGVDLGLDVARGPEDTIFYITFGHAWGRDMD